ncbi:TAXI family TRAP transporter solute-binding subunit [Sulfurospirillum sp. 1612]|uniref:TAXI family TRAP transporter solute-binding subunit n=1 Tax=Sulfurospirillum sp. 1612 TaxID=3094835 RepID=UPI002F95CF13
MKCEWCKILFPFGLIVLIVAIFSYQFIEPPAPKTIKIATGKTTGSYYKYALEYQKILKKEKFDLQIIPTAGSVEALSLLEAHKVDVAFVQGGTANQRDIKDLMSLCSIYYEPLWIFYKDKARLKYLYQFKGKKLYIGDIGSGTRALAEVLLKENNINADNTHFIDLKGEDPQRALQEGKVDAIFSVISPNSQKIQNLLKDKNLKLFSFQRAKAYSKKFSYLSALTLGEGIINLEKNIPSSNRILLGTTATLVSTKTLHPVLIKLLIKAAKAVHAPASIFSVQNEFPTSKYTQIPMSEAAQKYLIKGDSFLERIFPFWIANSIERLTIMIIPLLTLLFPLLKGALPLYRWRIRSKIYKWYKILHEVDSKLIDAKREDLIAIKKDLTKMLNEIQKDTKIPLSYMGEYYDLKVHANLILGKIDTLLKKPKD